ncbi:MAG: phosphoribosylformylglycinamidine synthase subunit PurL, partial [Chloroflexi bacterium]|nr:phosphoribosylformylglycinamidine synthase subunit PurL [Chloroflexota bacterium]
LSRRRLLSMDLAELRAVQRYFASEGRAPTDVELESIAQTWSEHCYHKTFKGVVDYSERTPSGVTQERIDSLIRTYLQAATNEIAAPWVRSAFVDNAGILDFAPGYEVSFKVETHNHPSALEPFGGANTGVGGVVRDIMGVSARPIANTDVLCFGPLDLPMDEVPGGVLHPRRIYSGVVHGVEDYGNKMGIPTVNGAIYFDPGYTANPLVYCGCVGIAPLGTHRNEAHPGDLIVVLGGRTGRDGLHGATFSSAELTDATGETTGGAVQIGNPITEKMTLDAILVARDEGLYSAITDCGAGGLSSAVSEMGEQTGVRVQLEQVPLKYQGLQPWEIWLSEAQERMVLAVPPQNEARLRSICEGFSVEMTVIGTFTGDQRLHLRYGDLAVADMAMSFLHKGIPRRHLTGAWETLALAEPDPAVLPNDLGQALLDILAMPNVRSKEDVVRRYDHEVLGGTVIKPFVGAADADNGPNGVGPGDATVLRPLEVVGTNLGFALGCGFNPAYGEIDPHAMA